MASDSSKPSRQGLRERRPTGSFEDLESCADQYRDKEDASTTTSTTFGFFFDSKLVKSLNLVAGFIVGRIKVKVTTWRLINTAVLLVFGAWKAVCAYQGASAVNTIDLASGLFWALITYWATILEAERPQIAPALFEKDVKTSVVRPLLACSIFAIIVLPLYTSGFILVSYVQQTFTRGVSGEVALLVEQLVAFAWLIMVVIAIAFAAHLPFLKMSYHLRRSITRIIINRDWNPAVISVETPRYLKRSAILLLFTLYCSFCYVVTKTGLFSNLRKPAIVIPAYVLSIGFVSLVFSFAVLYVFVGFTRMMIRLAKNDFRRGSAGDVYLK